MTDTASLYIHIPFCEQFCDYCDFYSVHACTDDARLDAYLDVLIEDVNEQVHSAGIRRIPSVYLGGGTPSVLGAERMQSLLVALATVPGMPADEITVEVNPHSLDHELLSACIAGGVTRISVGVQTFHEPSRQAVHRAGTAEQVKQGLRTIAAVFPGGFSVDLMTGLPFQDTAVLRTDIETLLLYEPAHISLYALTVEPGSALEQGKLLPDTDTADSLFIQGRDILEGAGFVQYEVSNFAKPGKHSLHNTRYWRMESWLGCGAGASGTVIDEESGTGLRTRYRDEADTYMIDRHRIQEKEYLDRLTLMKETFLMGFRYSDGPDPLLFEKRFGIGIRHSIPGTLSRWEAQGMIAPGKSALNSAGLLFLNLFLQDIFEEISEK